MFSNIFYFHLYLGKISNLTNIFQRGWFNHQPDNLFFRFPRDFHSDGIVGHGAWAKVELKRWRRSPREFGGLVSRICPTLNVHWCMRMRWWGWWGWDGEDDEDETVRMMKMMRWWCWCLLLLVSPIQQQHKVFESRRLPLLPYSWKWKMVVFER